MYGTYRSLTTLTAGALALHPQLQVLNHGLETLAAEDDLNFLSNFSKSKVEKFLDAATRLSAQRTKGALGGSIAVSHAFAGRSVVGKRYSARFGSRLLKEAPTCLLWKESNRIVNALREMGPSALLQMFNQEPRLVILVVIRNPVHIMFSHLTSFDTHIRLLGVDPDAATRNSVLDAVLEVFKEALDMQDALGKNRVFILHQSDFQDKDVLQQLEAFLGLPADTQWLQDALASLVIRKPKYTCTSSVAQHYHSRIGELFKNRNSWLYNKLYQHIPKWHREKLPP